MDSSLRSPEESLEILHRSVGETWWVMPCLGLPPVRWQVIQGWALYAISQLAPGQKKIIWGRSSKDLGGLGGQKKWMAFLKVISPQTIKTILDVLLTLQTFNTVVFGEGAVHPSGVSYPSTIRQKQSDLAKRQEKRSSFWRNARRAITSYGRWSTSYGPRNSEEFHWWFSCETQWLTHNDSQASLCLKWQNLPVLFDRRIRAASFSWWGNTYS